MKIALILASNKCYAPHMHNYIKILKENNIDFDIIIWNKDNLIENECISYDKKIDNTKSRFFKIKDYVSYSKFVIAVLKSSKYDKIIVFTIFLALILYPFLKKKYKNLFIFDIRDYSPILKMFKNIINPVIKISYATVISSPGFKNWLPKNQNYLISHNYQFYEELLNDEVLNCKRDKNIILTIGFIRDIETNISMINSFCNDDRYILQYVGRGIGYNQLKEYVENHKINNVRFLGGYEKKDENKYLNNISLMNILLNDDINSKTLMTNRFYLAISNNVPVIVNENSTQGHYVSKYKLGITINSFDDVNLKVTKYLNDIKREDFLKGRDLFLFEINKDQIEFESSFNNFINIKCEN
jgi:hypothetical protein